MNPNNPADRPLQIDAHGWCPQAQQWRSPNCDVRADGTAIDVLVIHNISLPPQQYGGPYIAQLFTNTLDFDADPYFDQLRALRVSSHFVIYRDGRLQQFVPTLQRAWHAGVSQFGDRPRCNDFSIGIELEGCDTEPFTDLQYACLCQLSHALQQAHSLRAVTGHEHIAPGRKTDPGPYFDWPRYRAQWTADLPATAVRAMPLFVTTAQKTQP